MPDLSSRGRYENELAAALLLSWDDPIRVALAGGTPDWDAMEGEIARRSSVPLRRATLAAAALMSLEMTGTRALPRDFDADTGQPDALARGLVSTRRSEWRSAESPQAWVDRWMSAGAAEAIAATEVTTAISNGEALVRMEFSKLGVDLEAVWRIDPRSNVCPVCMGLNGSSEKVWRRRFPNGPPAHVNCRCYLDYRQA